MQRVARKGLCIVLLIEALLIEALLIEALLIEALLIGSTGYGQSLGDAARANRKQKGVAPNEGPHRR
jgi:hypothetical protein